MAQVSAPAVRGRRRTLHIDMTPMVDLAFLLLTFFVLTMTINKSYVLPLTQPDDDPNANHPTVKRERVLTLTLGADDTILYTFGLETEQSTHYGTSALGKVVEESLLKRPDLVVLIKPTAKARYQNLIDVLDELNLARVKHYYLVKD